MPTDVPSLPPTTLPTTAPSASPPAHPTTSPTIFSAASTQTFTITFSDLSYAELASNLTFYDEFTSSYAAAVASGASVAPSQVEIVGVYEGSVLVDSLVQYTYADLAAGASPNAFAASLGNATQVAQMFSASEVLAPYSALHSVTSSGESHTGGSPALAADSLPTPAPTAGCTCDPLVSCAPGASPGEYLCGPCPPGYSGSGDAGCADVDEYELSPAGACADHGGVKHRSSATLSVATQGTCSAAERWRGLWLGGGWFVKEFAVLLGWRFGAERKESVLQKRVRTAHRRRSMLQNMASRATISLLEEEKIDGHSHPRTVQSFSSTLDEVAVERGVEQLVAAPTAPQQEEPGCVVVELEDDWETHAEDARTDGHVRVGGETVGVLRGETISKRTEGKPLELNLDAVTCKLIGPLMFDKAQLLQPKPPQLALFNMLPTCQELLVTPAPWGGSAQEGQGGPRSALSIGNPGEVEVQARDSDQYAVSETVTTIRTTITTSTFQKSEALRAVPRGRSRG
eukprot:gene16133-19136_t